jgi:hypothetical protein
MPMLVEVAQTTNSSEFDMDRISARRYGAVVALNLLVGALAVALPPITSASTTAHNPLPAASAHTITKHVRIQLVRNGGFHYAKADWSAVGSAKPDLRIIHPGQHSAHAARLTGSHHGVGSLTEHLVMTETAAGNRYVATAAVRSPRGAAKVELGLYEVNDGNVVGVASRKVVARHNWRQPRISYTAKEGGSTLVLDIGSRALRPRRGFIVDNAKVIQRTVVVQVPAKPTPVSSPPPASPAPAPTASVPATPPTTAPVSPSPSPTATATAPPVGPPAVPPTAPVASPTAKSCSLSAIDVPTCGVLWGVYAHPPGTTSWATALTGLEAQVGRKMDIAYRYHDFSGAGSSGAFPDASEQQLAAGGRIIMDDWQTVLYSDHSSITWPQVASGQYDASVIIPEAQRIKAFGKPMFLAFDHEMDSMVGPFGTPAQYVAAYQHIHDVFAQQGVTNVIWIWTITGSGGHDSLFKSLYPGNAYVDWIGYDPYNFQACHNSTTWKSFSQTVDPGYQWLESNGFGDKPFMLPEYGTVPDAGNSSAQANWYAGIPAGLDAHPNIKGMVQWDDVDGTCNITLNPNTTGLIPAFASAGQNAAVSIH